MVQVVLRTEQRPSEGEVIANDLMSRLGVAPGNLISGAYIDFIIQQHSNC